MFVSAGYYSNRDVIFLGFAERAALARDGGTNVVGWNVIGLKKVVLTHFYPIALDGLYLALVVRVPESTVELKFKVRTDTGEELSWLNLELFRNSNSIMPMATGSWGLYLAPMPAINLIIPKPGQYSMFLQIEGGAEENLGEFVCAVVDAPPLAHEQIAAIRSNPKGAKVVKAGFGCKLCGDTCQLYTALDRNPESEALGYTWYQDIPDGFTFQVQRLS